MDKERKLEIKPRASDHMPDIWVRSKAAFGPQEHGSYLACPGRTRTGV